MGGRKFVDWLGSAAAFPPAHSLCFRELGVGFGLGRAKSARARAPLVVRGVGLYPRLRIGVV